MRDASQCWETGKRSWMLRSCRNVIGRMRGRCPFPRWQYDVQCSGRIRTDIWVSWWLLSTTQLRLRSLSFSLGECEECSSSHHSAPYGLNQTPTAFLNLLSVTSDPQPSQPSHIFLAARLLWLLGLATTNCSPSSEHSPSMTVCHFWGVPLVFVQDHECY